MDRPEAEAQVKGFQGAVHQKFPTLDQAQAYLRGKRAASPLEDANGAGPSNGGSSKVAGELAAKRAKTASTTTHGRKSRSRSPGSRAERTRKVYCDGSCIGNGQKGSVAGIGIFWGHEVGSP